MGCRCARLSPSVVSLSHRQKLCSHGLYRSLGPARGSGRRARVRGLHRHRLLPVHRCSAPWAGGELRHAKERRAVRLLRVCRRKWHVELGQPIHGARAPKCCRERGWARHTPRQTHGPHTGALMPCPHAHQDDDCARVCVCAFRAAGLMVAPRARPASRISPRSTASP